VKGRKISTPEVNIVIKGLNYYWEVGSSNIVKGKFNNSDSTYDFAVDTKILNSKAILSVIFDSIEFTWNMDGVEPN
jgi:hypothetical protein